ncbi:MAG: PH domain-containing protein [Rickettsiales bacterium]
MPTIDEIWKQIDSLPHRYIFYTRKEIRYLPQILNENEHILAITSGFMQNRTWLAVCTNRRVLFLDRGMIFGLRQLQMNLDRIQTIDSSFGLIFGAISIWDGAASMSIGLILKSSVAPFVKTVQESMDRYKRLMVSELAATANNAHTTAANSGSLPQNNTMIAELERLAKLKADGHLNDIEYTAAKAKLLGS